MAHICKVLSLEQQYQWNIQKCKLGSKLNCSRFIYMRQNQENYSIMIPEARTWTKYHIFYGIVDSDGDGLDDRTGQPVNEPKPGENIKDDKPNKDDYDDGILGTISYYFDTFIWYIKQPFVFIADLISNIINWISSTIDGWIDGFTSILQRYLAFASRNYINAALGSLQ